MTLSVAMFICQTALAQPQAGELAQVWSTHHATITAHTEAPILLSDEDFDVVARGGVAKRRLSQNGPDRAIGVAWTPHSRAAVWVAIIDDIHNTMVEGLTEQRLGAGEAGVKLLYQRLDFPWPLNDRQWVIEIENDPRLAKATANQVWSRTWSLSDHRAPGVADPEALWAPTLDGGWLAIDVEGGTLIVYQARTTVGGVVPDGLVTSWAMSTLDEMLGNLFARAAEIPEHYTPDHDPIQGGDGRPIVGF